MAHPPNADALELVIERVTAANRAFEQRYPGDSAARQPLHVVYGGAQRFRSDTARKFGALALENLRRYAPDSAQLAAATGIPERVAETVYARVVAKIESEPVEDYRIDFEDGYGYRSDDEEDGHAASSAVELAAGMREGTLPPFTGIRLTPFSPVLSRRAVRTLELFLTSLVESGAGLPRNFAVTLPKITMPAQVAALDDVLGLMENRFGFAARSIAVELMVETPQVILNEAGVSAIPAMIDAAQGRCRGIHFGPYDYTSALNIASAFQSLSHPACQFARQFMLAGAAARDVFVSDGPTKLLPVTVHRGAQLTPEQDQENRAAVQRGMRAHCDDIRRALGEGIYQGWDLHPAQLPTRYAATYAFFLEGLDSAAARLRNFMADARQATLLGNLFDDAASGQGLLNFFLRGYACGALDKNDVATSGLSLDEIRDRSFARIMERRRAAEGKQ